MSIIALVVAVIALGMALLVFRRKPAPVPEIPVVQHNDTKHDDPMFIEVIDKDGKNAVLNVMQIRAIYVPVEGLVEIVHGTGNGYVEIPMQEYEGKLKAAVLKATM